MSAHIHPTAIIEAGVEVGDETHIWDHVHARTGSRIGRQCIIGEKTYIAGRVQIGDRCKVNAMVYLCDGVTLETGVMVSAGVVFTNDLLPRATTPDLRELRPSAFGGENLETRVCEGATIGANATILAGVTIGRFAMVGMGAAVTRPVGDFHLVRGNPAVAAAAVCRCGQIVYRFHPGAPSGRDVACACGRSYTIRGERVAELDPP